MLNSRNILQHGSDLNANVTYAVLITVKIKSLSNQLKTSSMLTLYCVMLRSSIIIILLCIYQYYYYYLARI